MSATVEISESNGSPETVTDGITNTNMGSIDSYDMDAADNPITPSENSYEKYQRFHVSAMGGSSKVYALKVWRTGALGGLASHKTNTRENDYVATTTYTAPVTTTSTVATQSMADSEPTNANLGIGGSLSGELTDVGYSDYLVHQIQTDVDDVEGSTSDLNYKYTEIA